MPIPRTQPGFEPKTLHDFEKMWGSGPRAWEDKRCRTEFRRRTGKNVKKIEGEWQIVQTLNKK